MLWNKDKSPITSLASLPLLVRKVQKKAYCLSTSVPAFLLSPLLSGIAFVKYPDWNQEGKEIRSKSAIMYKNTPKNSRGKTLLRKQKPSQIANKTFRHREVWYSLSKKIFKTPTTRKQSKKPSPQIKKKVILKTKDISSGYNLFSSNILNELLRWNNLQKNCQNTVKLQTTSFHKTPPKHPHHIWNQILQHEHNSSEENAQ